MLKRMKELIEKTKARIKNRGSFPLQRGVMLPTAFPRGTIVHYMGVSCELLEDVPYYSETLEAARLCDEAHLPGDCPRCGAT